MILLLPLLVIPIVLQLALGTGFFVAEKRSFRTLFRVLAILFLPLTCCTTVLMIPMIYNQAMLIRLREPFFNYPLPPQTFELRRESQITNITQNGTWDHCHFRVQRTLQTTLSENDLKDYYKDVLFSPIQPNSKAAMIWGKDGKLTVNVDFQDLERGIVTISIFDGEYEGRFMTIDPRYWTPP